MGREYRWGNLGLAVDASECGDRPAEVGIAVSVGVKVDCNRGLA